MADRKPLTIGYDSNNNASKLVEVNFSSIDLADFANIEPTQGQVLAFSAGSFAPSTISQIDHGALAGLADDDHTQYVLSDGTRPMSTLFVDGDMRANTASSLSISGVALNATNASALNLTATNLHVPGNIAVTGTVDGVDIATRDSVLTSTTTTANNALPKAGGTMTGPLNGTTINATTSVSSASVSAVNLNATNASTLNLTATNGTINTTPTNDAHIASKSYVDGINSTQHNRLFAVGTKTDSIANTTVYLGWEFDVANAMSVSDSGGVITLGGTGDTEITFGEAGDYMIDCTARCNADNRVELFVRAEYYDATEETPQFRAKTRFQASNYAARDTDQNTGDATLHLLLSLNQNDKLRFEAEGDSDGTCVLLVNGTFLRIVKLA